MACYCLDLYIPVLPMDSLNDVDLGVFFINTCILMNEVHVDFIFVFQDVPLVLMFLAVCYFAAVDSQHTIATEGSPSKSGQLHMNNAMAIESPESLSAYQNSSNTTAAERASNSSKTLDNFNKEDRNLQKLYLQFYIVSVPVVCGFGTVGNILSFCVFLRRNLRSCSTAIYLTALAIADTLVLWWDPSYGWVRRAFGSSVKWLPTTMCNIRYFGAHFTYALAAYLVVAMAVERLLVVFFPLTAHVWLTVKR